jgi:hypothetical protein
MDFQPKSMRICKLRLRGKFHNYSIVCAHAPTKKKSDHEEDFLRIVRESTRQLPGT